MEISIEVASLVATVFNVGLAVHVNRLRGRVERDLDQHRTHLATSQRLHERRCLAISELHASLVDATASLLRVTQPDEMHPMDHEEWDRTRIQETWIAVQKAGRRYHLAVLHLAQDSTAEVEALVIRLEREIAGIDDESRSRGAGPEREHHKALVSELQTLRAVAVRALKREMQRLDHLAEPTAK